MDPGRAPRLRDGRWIWLAATVCALMLLMSGCAQWGRPDVGEEPLRFIVMADPQFGMTAAAHEGVEGFAAETALFEQAIAEANLIQPRFVVICGDLINSRGDTTQSAELFRIAAQLDPDIDLHLVAGNHDVENVPTVETLEAYRGTFGEDWYSFDEGDCHFSVLNSCLIQHPEGAPAEAARQMDWLRRDLAANAEAEHRIIFMHHPVCLADPDEGDDYFVLPRERRAPFLALLHEHGVAAVFSGHYHRNAVTRDGDLELVTSGPVGMPIGEAESGFRLVEVGSAGLSHEYLILDGLRTGVEGP